MIRYRPYCPLCGERAWLATEAEVRAWLISHIGRERYQKWARQ